MFFFSGEKVHEHTTELQCIISGLQPSTSYEISVSFYKQKNQAKTFKLAIKVVAKTNFN